MATPIRFQGLVKTTAEIEADKFAGRIGWNTTLARFVAYYNSTQYAQMARRDVLETFAQGIQDSTQTAGRLTYATTGGRLAGDAGLLFSQTGGVTDSLIVGDGSVNPRIIINGANSVNSSLYLQGNGFNRWGFIRVANSNVLLIRAHDAAGAAIDSPININNSAGGLITLGGAGRDVSLTGGLQIGGARRISSAGRFDATSLYNSAWGGSGIRPLLTDNAGMGYATDAATFRGAIGAASTNRLGSEAATSIYISGSDGYFYDGFTPFASFGGNKFGVDALYDFYRNATWISKNEGGYADSGRFYCRNGLWVGLSGIELQVVGGRKTGWSAATGTASRSTFATSSVTLPQLAERVKALLDDLISHGLIGA